MPVYDYKCPEGHHFSVVKSIKNHSPRERCPHCEKEGERHITQPPMVRGDYPGYACPITGDWIEGRKAHEENLKRHGCRILEPGESAAVAKHRQATEAALDAALEDTAAKAFEALDTRAKEKLAGEFDAGVDATVVRSTVTSL